MDNANNNISTCFSSSSLTGLNVIVIDHFMLDLKYFNAVMQRSLQAYEFRIRYMIKPKLMMKSSRR